MLQTARSFSQVLRMGHRASRITHQVVECIHRPWQMTRCSRSLMTVAILKLIQSASCEMRAETEARERGVHMQKDHGCSNRVCLSGYRWTIRRAGWKTRTDRHGNVDLI